MSTDNDPEPSPYAKPYADDLDDLPSPIPHILPRASHPILDTASGPLWLAAGMLLATALLGIPGCVATGPTVSAKADVSVKEVGHIATVARVGGGGSGGVMPNGGTGEVTASLSIDLRWPNPTR